MYTLSAQSVLSRLFNLRTALPLTIALLLGSSVAQAAPTGWLNDTGETQCANASDALVACDSATTGDAGTRPRQDGRFGRDVASPSKLGGGAAGFDFSKVCFNGDVQGAGTCTGTLVANTGTTATGSANTDWACTKDNVTNLIWSLQSGYGDWTTYGQTTLPAATNSANRCGFNSDWRLPTRLELLGIVHNGLAIGPMIDTSYFPATQNNYYWTSDTYAAVPTAAWWVSLSYGHTSYQGKATSYYVRLVRSGP